MGLRSPANQARPCTSPLLQRAMRMAYGTPTLTRTLHGAKGESFRVQPLVYRTVGLSELGDFERATRLAFDGLRLPRRST